MSSSRCAVCTVRVSVPHPGPDSARPYRSVVACVLVLVALRRDLVEQLGFPVEQSVMEAGCVAGLPQRLGGGHGQGELQVGELLPHGLRYLAVAMQVAQLDRLDHLLQAVHLLNAEPAACSELGGAG